MIIGGDYESALNVLRVEKLVDKHIRRFPKSDVAQRLFAAVESMDATEIFEAAHALKGVCSNLGLTGLAEKASVITEEYRPGNERHLTDDEVKACVGAIKNDYETAAEGIRLYEVSGE